MPALPTILYHDETIIAIDKPSGLLVHPSADASDRITCLSVVRDMTGRYVYPLHRLDRGTSGVILMGLDVETTRAMQGAFARREVAKRYWAVVRGWMTEDVLYDRPLRKRGTDDGREEAVTSVHPLGCGTLPYPVGRYEEARYSLVEARPVTGRRHQIRRHLSNNDHPILGDAVHGDGRHNRLLRQLFNCHHLLLHAAAITFTHPHTSERLTIRTPLPADMVAICDRLGWSDVVEEWNRASVAMPNSL